MRKNKKPKHGRPPTTQQQALKAKHTTSKDKPTKTSPTKQNASPSARPQPATPSTIPFDPADRFLLLGEGDFSFSRSLIEHHHCHDIIATCLDSQTELYEKYDPQAEANTQYLTDAGQEVIYGLDATKLDQSKPLRKLLSNRRGGGQGGGFAHIFFNFPHIGGKSTDVNRQVRANQELLVGFFKSAQLLLDQTSSTGGAATIVVTLFEGEPYTLWNIRDLARHAGLVVVRSFRFVASAYPGYSHARTLGNVQGAGSAWKGEEREARSYVFARKEGESALREGSGRKRKRGMNGRGSEDEG